MIIKDQVVDQVRDQVHKLIYDQVWTPVNVAASKKVKAGLNQKILDNIGNQPSFVITTILLGGRKEQIWSKMKDDLWRPLRITYNEHEIPYQL
jgi:hypothetical protein